MLIALLFSAKVELGGIGRDSLVKLELTAFILDCFEAKAHPPPSRVELLRTLQVVLYFQGGEMLHA